MFEYKDMTDLRCAANSSIERASSALNIVAASWKLVLKHIRGQASLFAEEARRKALGPVPLFLGGVFAVAKERHSVAS